MAVGSGQDFIYLLCQEDSLLYYIPINEDPNSSKFSAVVFEPTISCRTIDVSPVGVLWCVKPEGLLFLFDAHENAWVSVGISPQLKLSLAKAIKLQSTLQTMEWIEEDINRLRRVDRLNGK